jgi:LAO/AO transport system kinase
MKLADLIASVTGGDVRSVARAARMVDDRLEGYQDLLKALWPHCGRAWILGVTGNPGAGKSTLVDRLIEEYRRLGQRVGVVAVDPSSPFSGGAILGDRIRMQRHTLDSRVFIRSMGARGHLGGLSVATREAIRLIGAFGFDYVILETVGVGQAELEVAAIADTTLVLLTPGLGDGVQMIKAGIMEIADVFVVNKADLPSAQKTMQELRAILNIAPEGGWRPPIVATVAIRGEGVEDVMAAVESHLRYQDSSPQGQKRAAARLKDEAADLVGEWSRAEARRLLDEDPELAERLLRDRIPYAAAEEILTRGRASHKADGQWSRR